MRRFEYFVQIELKTQSKKGTINHTNNKLYDWTNNQLSPDGYWKIKFKKAYYDN